jgi:hypothetical protein
MLDTLNVHKIVKATIDVPNYDHNWVDLNVVNDKGEKFEFCMFLKDSHEQSVDAYYFLVELRDSVEKAIRSTLINQKEKSDEQSDD